MLTRPGSEPGPAWMRELALDPRRLRKAILRIVIFLGLIQVMFFVLGNIVVYRAHGKHVRAYTSQTQIVGMVAIGRYAYAGPGVALGRDEASGQQKESLFG